MRSRPLPSRGLALLALVAALLLPAVALAGGVAVTLDRPPTDVHAGVAFSFGFSIRSAHGDDTPVSGITPTIIASSAAADRQVTATARAEGAAGHYVATLTFPVAGEWQWQIRPFAEDPRYVLALPGPLVVRAAGAPAAKAAPAAAQFEVVADDSFFKVEDMQVPAGATLKWTNVGKLPHTIKANDGSFASGNLDHNATYAFTFAKPGTYPYYCEYHGGPDGSGMAGIITVVASAASAPSQLPNTGTGDGWPLGFLVAAIIVVVGGIALRRGLSSHASFAQTCSNLSSASPGSGPLAACAAACSS